MKMKLNVRAGPTEAMTAFEALVVIVLLALLAAVLLPGLAVAKRKASLITCNGHVKGISLAFQVWEGDHWNEPPVQFYSTNDVMMKAVTNGCAWRLWQVMSNGLSTPKILRCPADPHTASAVSFTHDFSDKNISYFFNLDATESDPQLILAGDDNLAVDGHRATPGILSLWTNSLVSWTNERHHDAGNIALADGSVMEVASNGLNAVLVDSGTNIVRLVIP